MLRSYLKNQSTIWVYCLKTQCTILFKLLTYIIINEIQFNFLTINRNKILLVVEKKTYINTNFNNLFTMICSYLNILIPAYTHSPYPK